MTMLAELVEESKDRRITWLVTGEWPDFHLSYRDPYGAMSDDFLEEIRKRKGAFIDIVLQQQEVGIAGR